MHTQSATQMGWKVIVMLALSSVLAGCGINTIPTLDEQVKAAWSQVQNQYQRRADLIPNLVETVKGAAKQEQATLTAVIEARAKQPRFKSMPAPWTTPKSSSSSKTHKTN